MPTPCPQPWPLTTKIGVAARAALRALDFSTRADAAVAAASTRKATTRARAPGTPPEASGPDRKREPFSQTVRSVERGNWTRDARRHGHPPAAVPGREARR